MQAVTVGWMTPGNLTRCTNCCTIKFVHLNLQHPFLLNSPVSLEIFKLFRHLAVSLFYLNEQQMPKRVSSHQDIPVAHYMRGHHLD